jgi:hypothetical protein
MPEVLERTTLLCLFRDDRSAAAAVHDLLGLGLTEAEIAVVGDARTELTGEIPTATLASIRIPSADLPRIMDGLHDGGTLVAVQAAASFAEPVERAFAKHSATLVDETVVQTPLEIGHFTHSSSAELHLAEPNRLDMIESEETE